MSNKLYNKRLLMAKIGAGEYPTDAVPTAADNAILTSNLKFQPFQGATVVLDYDRRNLGAGKSIYTGTHAKLTCDVDISGAGAAGDVPPWGALLRMCGFSETVEEGVSVVYAPVSEGFEWGTMYFNHDGKLQKMQGVRGNVSFGLTKEGLPKMSFEFWGLWNAAPTAVAFGEPDFDAFVEPIPVNAVNTPTFTVDAFAANAESFTFNAGWTVSYRNVVGNEAVLITDRDGSGAMTLETVALADYDFYETVRECEVVPINLVHGTEAGNIVQFDAKAQLMMGEDSDSQGLSVTPFNLRLVPTLNDGDDELIITVK
ncbi:hypothetical protein JN531_012755 [Flagellatimonas centrodinii]|uniref:hypothetical protein n=1 Tax=Flagellatimonas centrodinii TaxID=2806210 RepID=UPI001FEE4D8D|nr:hypothetical protein [Flagellatimonas centrodinii]ULQ45970.1 hypothetical protein JN531_012755 [Flagellatimonas centrodinii]